MPRAVLLIAVILGCFGFAALAQPAVQTDKKSEGKEKVDLKSKGKEADKTKPPEKSGETAKEPSKSKTPLDKIKLPKDAILIVVDDLLNAPALFPKSAAMSFEAWLKLHERIEALERQLKPDKKTPGLCKLHGKLEGDFVVFRAEFGFSTDEPKTTLFLGLKGAYLMDEGKLDGKTPFLEPTDEGFTVRVDKPADEHRLTLSFRVPAQAKKIAGGAIERGLKLDLPGSAATPLVLELPANVKELVWNDTLEKAKTPGHWTIGLGTTKSVSLSWKEPAPLAGNAQVKIAEGQLKIDVNATHVNVSADLFLEDRGVQTTKWHLVLPAQTKADDIKVTAPGGLTHDLVAPDKEKPYWTLDTSSATAERWRVTVSLALARPNPGVRVPVGPFHVLGAFQQQGAIQVTMPAEFNLGQRLVPTRVGAVFQQTNTETEATFKYVVPQVSEKNLKAVQAIKAPLELEWRVEKSQVESRVEHLLKLHGGPSAWDVDATSYIHVSALFATIHYVDLKLPLRPRGAARMGPAAPVLDLPGSFPWASLWRVYELPWSALNPDDISVYDDKGKSLKFDPPDASGKTRVFLERKDTKKATLVLKTAFRVPPQNHRLRVELPRPLNTLDRGGKVVMEADKHIELLYGPEGAEEPVPDRHQFEQNLDQAPAAADLAWRTHHREVAAQAVLDILVHEHSAQVTQVLRFSRDALAADAGAKRSRVEFRLPRGMGRPPALAGGEIILYDPNAQKLLVEPELKKDKAELKLEYDVAMVKGHLNVTPIWPASVSQKDIKIRVWTAPGVRARLTDGLVQGGVWQERSIEAVAGKNEFPSLVLHGNGANLPLALVIQDASASSAAAFLADRALIQARVQADGSQQVRALYMVRKIHAPHADIELPLAESRLRERPTVMLGGKTLKYTRLDGADKVIRVELRPELTALPAVLEINYTVPADGMEGNSFWRTTMAGPIFRSEVVILEMHWQLTMPTPVLAFSPARRARPDVVWRLQGWLPTPEPSATSAELESWLTGRDPVHAPVVVTYAFAHVNSQPETVYHLPRPWWLLGCSGLFLVVALGSFFAPVPRVLFWALLVVLALTVFGIGTFWPAALAPVVFGLQPGVALFVVFAVGHWLVQAQYRRQLVFMSGFSRAKPGSTMVRADSAKRPRDASTVDDPDAPVDTGSSKPGGTPAGS